MKWRRPGWIGLAALACGCACSGGPGSTHAAENRVRLPAEYRPVPFPEDRLTASFYVDGESAEASDRNSGAEGFPLKTIARAIALARVNNQFGIGAKIIIKPGTYREALTLLPGATDAPLKLEASEPGAAVISGSDVWSEWQRVNGDTYRHDWPYRWGAALYPPNWAGEVVLEPVVRRRELVALNGELYMQVMDTAALKPGTFAVSESERAIYIRSQPGVDMSKALIEVGIRPRLLLAENRSNLALYGLRFVHGNAAVQNAAVQISSCENVVLDNCWFSDNNWIGLGLSGIVNLACRRISAQHNGATGLDTYQLKNALFDNLDTSFNNWRGALGNFYGWSVAGAKLTATHVALIRSHRSMANQARGIWLDYDNTDITLELGSWSWNENDGVFIEANQGPIAVRRSTVWGNRSGSGLLGANSSDVVLEGNTIYANEDAQVKISGDRSRNVRDWETGASTAVRIMNWTLQGNTIGSSAITQYLIDSANWPHFFETLVSGSNRWILPADVDGFRIGTRRLTFQQWQTTTGQDADSLMQIDPNGAAQQQ